MARRVRIAGGFLVATLAVAIPALASAQAPGVSLTASGPARVCPLANGSVSSALSAPAPTRARRRGRSQHRGHNKRHAKHHAKPVEAPSVGPPLPPSCPPVPCASSGAGGTTPAVGATLVCRAPPCPGACAPTPCPPPSNSSDAAGRALPACPPIPCPLAAATPASGATGPSPPNCLPIPCPQQSGASPGTCVPGPCPLASTGDDQTGPSVGATDGCPPIPRCPAPLSPTAHVAVYACPQVAVSAALIR